MVSQGHERVGDRHSNESGLLLRNLKLHLYLRLTLTIKNLKGKLISLWVGTVLYIKARLWQLQHMVFELLNHQSNNRVARWLVDIEKAFKCFCKQLSSRATRCHKKSARDEFLVFRAVVQRLVNTISALSSRHDRDHGLSWTNGVHSTSSKLSGW